MAETSPTQTDYQRFQARVRTIVEAMWEGYKARREAAVEAGAPWDDAAEREAAAMVAGTPLAIFDLTGDGLISEWSWDGSDVELAEAFVRDVTSPFPTGQVAVPAEKLAAIVALSEAEFEALEALARRGPRG